jgi:hypothetical protein
MTTALKRFIASIVTDREARRRPSNLSYGVGHWDCAQTCAPF